MSNENNFLNPASPLAKSQQPYFIIRAVIRNSILLCFLAEILSSIGNRMSHDYNASKDTPISLMLLAEAIFTCFDQLLCKTELQLIPDITSRLETQLQDAREKSQTDITQNEIHRLESELNLAKDQLEFCRIIQNPTTYSSENIGALGLTSVLVFTQSLINPTSSCNTLQLSVAAATGAALGNRYKGAVLNAYKALQKTDTPENARIVKRHVM